MKKNYLVLLALSFQFFCVKSQTATFNLLDQENHNALVNNTDTFFHFTSAFSSTTHDFDIKNISAGPQTYSIKKYIIILNKVSPALEDTAKPYYCTGILCYGAGTSSSSITLSANETVNLKIDLDECSIPAHNFIKYSVTNMANPADSIQINMDYMPQAGTGIKAQSKAGFSFDFMPNPAKEKFAFILSSAKNFTSQIVIYNSLGEMVYQKNLQFAEGKNEVNINVEKLPAGLYFGGIKTGDSFLSKKLVIQ